MAARQRMAASLEQIAASRLDGSGLELSLAYYPNVATSDGTSLQEAFQQKLRNGKHREDACLSTVTGPHRDRFYVKNRGRDMRRYASQGEVRMAVLATKLALVEYLGMERGLYPVLLFDDILLEIDHRNIETILERFTMKNQLFFTSTGIPEVEYFNHLSDACFLALQKENGVQV